MSDNIPLELQVEIIKRVPVKTLLQFRSVSKQWKSLIDSPDFADDYCALQSHPHRLLIRYMDDIEHDEPFTSPIMVDLACIRNGFNYKYISIADDDDDDTFHHQQIPSTTIPNSVNIFEYSTVVGCCDGLVCFYAYDPYRHNSFYIDKSVMATLWNPWIKKSVDVLVPNVPCHGCETILGFGVSLQTKDPKIVKINSAAFQKDTSVAIPWRVEVFSLSSGTWKTPSCASNNLPFRNSIQFHWSQVALNGVIYLLAYERISVNNDNVFRNHSLIMSFDLSTEEFQEVCLPDNLAYTDTYYLSISKRMESVVVLEEFEDFYGVWMMGQGVTKSFTKLFNVSVRTQEPHCFLVCGFMKNGEPIVDHGSDALFAYGSYLERIKDLGIVGKSFTFIVNSYMKTLLLIDH